MQYDAIMRDYSRKQLKSRHEQEQHTLEAYEKFPRLEEIDHQVASLSVEKARELLAAPGTGCQDLQDKIRTLAQERQKILLSNGYPADYLEPHYECPLCQDTGYIDNKKCVCFKKAAIDLLYTQSNIKEILKKENFSHFSFDYYSDTIKNEATGLSARQTAQAAVKKAKAFIAEFDSSFANLFLYGDTGVGKTFLSHCIAKELISTAHCVIYFSAFDLFDLFARNKFTPSGDSADINEYIFDCDLLMIDDLGTELTNSFVSSQLFLLINERIMRQKSTLISTNLTMESFSELYSERTFSRICSYYDMIKLIGKDIRIQKKFRRM